MPAITPLSSVATENYGAMESDPDSPISAIERQSPASEPLLANPPSEPLSDNKVKIAWRNMTRTQRINYLKALFFRGANKSNQVFNEKMRSSLATLSGVQLSGILNTQTQTLLNSWLWFWGRCGYSDPVQDTSYLPIDGPGISLKKTIDNILIAPIDYLTYGAAVGWFIAHTITPRIPRYLSMKEDLFMRRIFEEQKGVVESNEVSQSKPSTIADKINYLIEYVMPVLFDGSQIALFLRFIQKSMGHLAVSAGINAPLISFDVPPLAMEMEWGFTNTELKIFPGEDPVSPTTLYILVASGIVCYLLQALCNFNHDLQTKEIEYTPDAKDAPDVQEEPTP